MKKKVVWLPYDMDTAIGINNEGGLVFSYNLEDTDYLAGGANIFNGQDSVLWNNVRLAFFDELKAMYQRLRSQGVLSYEKVEEMFEEHQSKWPEAIFNEDAYFKYIMPLIESGTATYLDMLQGSKAEQRKWWLYNRFRYIDSKYNAGDALSDFITLRGYAAADITVIPYADIYPAVKYGSYLVSTRGQRNTATTLVNPLETLNDTEIAIYSSSQLASVGDLSPLKVGLADFSMATKLQAIKIGDADSSYQNTNLASLSLGNNVLLKTLDVRNCVGLGDTSLEGHTQTAVDISGCEIIEEVYFDGTKIKGLTLPNGGVLKVLHLPATITNLTIRNQKAITDLSIASYDSITTLWLENLPTVDTKAIFNRMTATTRVRLIGFTWEATDATEIEALLDKLDTMRGLDESGGNVDKAQVSGTIHTSSLTGAEIAAFKERYQYLNIDADHTTSVLRYYNGSTLVQEETILDGGDGTYTGTTPTKSQDAQYTYTFAGWSKDDDNTVDSDALTNVVADRNVYACFTGTLRKYTVTFVRASEDGGGTLQTISDVDYGTTITAASSYTGSTPTTTQGDATDYPFEGWEPASATVTGNTTFTAKFGSPIEVKEITDNWATILSGVNTYKLGNYKPLDLGTEGIVNMQIVAVNTDNLASGTGKAKYTWVAKEVLATTHRMNPANNNGEIGTGGNGGWENCEMRTYLKNTIKPLIPAEVRNAIVEVTKIQSTVTDGTMVKDGQTTIDDVWIPSIHEIFGTDEFETTGPVYTTVYNSASDRIKYKSGSASYWWLRSAFSTTHFRYVSTNGDSANSRATTTNGVALGFCTN